MTYIVTVSEKGYCSEVLMSVAETGDICPQTTLMIVAAHDRYQRSVSRIYYIDGMVVDVNVSTNYLLAKLESKTSFKRTQQIEAFYRLLPPALIGQMRSWIMQNYAFIPVTSYKSGPTTWVNARYISDVQTRGMQTSIILVDGSVLNINKHKDKFMKQLVATKIVSLWMTQYAFGYGDHFDKMLLPFINWPAQVAYQMNRDRLQYLLIVTSLENLMIKANETNINKINYVIRLMAQ